ncbi:hypothetical protein BDZ89DRAFT_1096256 [Hymenopellis radicata]|nr:hypothetical protein BDZ89DRAFT_1096256 [Hymenopellis radicata]
MRREAYQYQEQSPSDHIKNVNRYLHIASSLVPKDPALCHFRIRHPTSSRAILFRRPARLAIRLDPAPFLSAGIPERLQNYDDPISQSMTRPSLPENFEDLDETEQSRAKKLYYNRFIHYHYVKSTAECNELHYAALTDPVGMLRRRLFCHASDPWEGETLALKNWETLTGEARRDVRETMKLDEVQRGADEALEGLRNVVGSFGPEDWVSSKNYEEAMTRSKLMKEQVLAAAALEGEEAEIALHWPLDDMDEEKYM